MGPQKTKTKKAKSSSKSRQKVVASKHITPNVKWRTWVERFQIFDDVVNSLQAVVNGNEVCIKSDVFGDVITVGDRIGAPSKYGEAYQALLIGKKYKLAIKKVVLTKKDQGRAYTREQMLSGNSAWAELAAYMLGTILVMAKICNNLPLTYKYTLCQSCRFVNKELKGNPVKPCIIVLNEFAEGDLKHYLGQPHRWSLPLITNCVFQVAAGLYAFEKYFRGMTHNDLHYGNVLVHEIKPGGYWLYKIDGKRYYVPNLGYVFVLWDFGMVHIPGYVQGMPLENNETDIGQISYLINDSLKTLVKGTDSIIHDLVRLEGQITLKEIIEHMFTPYRTKPTSAAMLDEFNMDTSIESLREAVPSHLQQFLTSSNKFRSYSR